MICEAQPQASRAETGMGPSGARGRGGGEMVPGGGGGAGARGGRAEQRDRESAKRAEPSGDGDGSERSEAGVLTATIEVTTWVTRCVGGDGSGSRLFGEPVTADAT